MVGKEPSAKPLGTLRDKFGVAAEVRSMLDISASDSQPRSAHLGEISAILAAGLQRLLDRKSSPVSARAANSSLDWGPPLGGDVSDKSEDIAP
jgi:hypothetical protein